MLTNIYQANERIGHIMEWLKDKEHLFYPLNLKLHNASYYAIGGELEKDFPHLKYQSVDLFNDFCEDAYYYLIEYCDTQGIDFERMQHYIRRTSSFYLHDQNILELDRQGKPMYAEVVQSIIYYYYSTCSELVWNEDGYIIGVDGDIEVSIDELDYITNELLQDLESYTHDMEIVYSYIQLQKEYQVDNFKAFCSDVIDESPIHKASETLDNVIDLFSRHEGLFQTIDLQRGTPSQRLAYIVAVELSLKQQGIPLENHISVDGTGFRLWKNDSIVVNGYGEIDYYNTINNLLDKELGNNQVTLNSDGGLNTEKTLYTLYQGTESQKADMLFSLNRINQILYYTVQEWMYEIALIHSYFDVWNRSV